MDISGLFSLANPAFTHSNIARQSIREWVCLLSTLLELNIVHKSLSTRSIRIPKLLFPIIASIGTTQFHFISRLEFPKTLKQKLKKNKQNFKFVLVPTTHSPWQQNELHQSMWLALVFHQRFVPPNQQWLWRHLSETRIPRKFLSRRLHLLSG